jgi:hypothetical protein
MIDGMRGWAHSILAGWFAITMTMAQSCMVPPQSANPPLTHPAPAVGSGYSSGSTSRDPADPPPAPEAASADTHIDTTGYTADDAESRALTDYLTQHRLPLVGAQVLNGPDGGRAVVLYGFVGSEFGRNDAAEKARRFTADSSITVDNRIKVRPELLASKGASAPSTAVNPDSGSAPSGASSPDSSSPDNSYPGVDSYVQQQNNAAAAASGQYPMGQGSGGSSMAAMLPLIIMLGAMSMGMASGGGSGFSMGSGMGGSPFGYSPYGPGTGYPSTPPYGPSYGAPSYGGGSSYGGPPYGGSPYGGSPYPPTSGGYP